MIPMQSLTGRYVFLILIIKVLFFSMNGMAQDDRALQMIYCRKADSVMLRWAPNNAPDWFRYSKSGFTLQRYVITRDSSRVFPPEESLLSNSIKAAGLREWQKLSHDNKYSSIVAQALYGSSFQLDIKENADDLPKAIQLSEDLEARYSYTMLATDNSFAVAQMAGLGYVDTRIQKGESYLYKLFGNGGATSSDTVFVFVPPRISPPLPAVRKIHAEFKDQIVNLRWSKSDYPMFTGYLIERSIDNQNYDLISDELSITTNEDGLMQVSDSIVKNGIKIYYKVRGVSAFGIVGPPSDPIDGMGTEDFIVDVGITRGEERDDGLWFEWQVRGQEGDSLPDFKQYLLRSGDGHSYVFLDSMNSSANTYLDKTPLVSNYYKVVIAGSNGNNISSLPYFVQLVDSLPPMPPRMLQGVCDTNGVVRLKWAGSDDQEVAGYRVFRSRLPDSEYRQLTARPVIDRTFIDSVNLKSLDRRMYYKIRAVDNRGNLSDFSVAAKVFIKDKVAPVPPRFSGYKVEQGKVYLEWVNSSSRDLATTRLFRKMNEIDEMLLEFDAENMVSSYLDSTASGVVEYYLEAEDKSGNQVNFNYKIKVHGNYETDQFNLNIKMNSSLGNLKLSWVGLKNVKEYIVYRALNENPLTVYRVLPSGENEYKDTQLQLGAKYSYLIKAITYSKGLITSDLKSVEL